MFFLVSATIAANHRELEDAIGALDGYLHANEGHAFRVGHAAGILRLDRELVRRLLNLYRSEGVVKREVGYICPDCDGFLARVPGEGDLWCDVCEKSFSFRGDAPIGEQVWRTVPEAVKTILLLPAEAKERGPLLDNAPTEVVIQFIAGDRGGGPRAQIPIPREEKKIKESIALGARRDDFRFAPSVFAASIDEVIACQQHRPVIVHVVGHGEERQMVLVRDRDPLVEMMRLHQDQAEVLFRNFPDRVRLVVFNTCHSIDLARHLVGKGAVDMAIGIEGKIPDDHAVRFAATFYRQLAEGRSVQAAFELAGIHAGDLDAPGRPQLLHAAGVDPAAVTFGVPRAE
jgi:CHAT domain